MSFREYLRERRGIRAAFLTGLSLALSNVVRLVNNLVLSHLLVPEAFGTVALANVIVQSVLFFCEFGVGACVIQHSDGDEPHFVNTAWTVQIVRGVIVSLFVVAIAGPAASWYQEPSLYWVTIALSLVPLFQCANSTAIYSANRNLSVGRVAIIDLASQLGGAVIMCGVAVAYPTVWSLVIGTVASSLLMLLSSHLFLPSSQNRLCWDWTVVAKLVSFGKWIAITSAIMFLASQMDRLLLGKFASLTELGIYHLAASLVMLPTLIVGRLAATVQFPLLSQAYRDQSKELEHKLYKTRRGLVALGASLCILLFLLGPLFFRLLYGEAYWTAGALVQWLVASSWFAMLVKSVDHLLLAMGNARQTTWLAAINLVSVTFAAALGYHIAEMPGFCFGLAAGWLLTHCGLLWMLTAQGIRGFWLDLQATVLVASALLGIYLLQKGATDYVLGTSWVNEDNMRGHYLAIGISAMAFMMWAISQRALFLRLLGYRNEQSHAPETIR